MRYVFLICLFVPFTVSAEEPSSLHSKLNTSLASPALLEEAIVAGKERAFVCKYCHGEDGNSTRDYIPNLAEQNPKYLLEQFEMFASKQRDNKIMSELAKVLTDEDRINISLYYFSQEAKPGPALPPELSTKGAKAFQARCSICHGNDGHGKEKLPRIASQPTEYLKRTLNSYRTNPDFRSASPMQAIVGALNESEQATVISYISSMK
ncbi:MAG: c-type cytochrome [Gammaproteobacteria bacterium]|nr:c-type cytochrome [Gammaproteobacteria bacterium]